MARVALTAMTRVQNLDKCDQQSIARCLLDLAQLGLEPDGRFAHLLAFRNNKRNTYECQLIVDYRGYVQLAYRSGMVKSIYADVVHEGDDFAFERGHVVRHTKWEWRSKSSRPEMRGALIGVYASVYLVNGGEAHLALTVDEVNAVRARSKSRDDGPWKTDFEAMARKTAFKRLTKWIPLSAEIRSALEADDDDIDVQTPRSRNELLLSEITSGRDERVVEAEASPPKWIDALTEVRILVDRAPNIDALHDIEAGFLAKFDDPAWQEEVMELLRAKARTIEE